MARKPDSPPDIAARTLAALLHDILASGRKPLDAPDIADAVAVHDLRKAFKRWRAILGLIAPVIGEEAELMRVEARDLAGKKDRPLDQNDRSVQQVKMVAGVGFEPTTFRL